MSFVIIDLEFNNLSGIHKKMPEVFEKIPSLKNLELVNEIIEVGVIKVDIYMKPISEFKVYIKPTAIPILNPYITEITGIQESDLENGVSFIEAMDKLSDMVDENDIICSWAKDDIVEIIRNSDYHNYKNISWIKKYLDLQDYATKILGSKKTLSLSNALKLLNIKHDNNKLHDALNDAIYEFFVFKSVYNSRAIKNYIIDDVFSMPALEIKSLGVSDIDYKKVKEKCPKCDIEINIDVNFSPLGWRFISLGSCFKCNNSVLNELVIKKTLSGDYVYKEKSSIIDELEYSRLKNRINDKQ